MIRFALLVLLLGSSLAFAQPDAGVPSTESDRSPSGKSFSEDIVVQGEQAERDIALAQPQAVDTLTRQELTRSEGVFLENALNLVPGVRMESRTTSGGQRITIRGYGNSTNFNGTGYKAYLNGIPITDAEGTTLLDDIDASTLGHVEVIKGPASSLYGSGIGGVLQLSTVRPPPMTTRFSQDFLGGGYGLLRTNTRAEHATDDTSVLVNYGHQAAEGYRVHSRSRKDFLFLAADFKSGSRQSVSAYAAFNKSYEELAGQLTEEQFTAHENVAEPAYLANEGHVLINSGRFGVSHDYEFTPSLRNVASVYLSGYQLGQPFAVGRTDNLALNAGARDELRLHYLGRGWSLTGVLGAEGLQSRSFRKSYGLTGGVLGGLRGDLQVTAVQSNFFAQADLALPYDFTLTAGASLSLIRYSIRDQLTNSANPTHADQSGTKDFAPVLTPRAALLKAITPRLSVYAQVSEGYSPLTSGSVVIPAIGAVNTDLRPERGTLFELGTKGNLLGGRWWYELALFDLEVRDKLTPQAVTSETGSVLYTITTNAGRQSNRGLELATKYAVIDAPDAVVSLVQPWVSYTLSQFQYTDFKSDNNNNAATQDYTGKRVAGVPPNVLDLGLDVALRWGVYLHGAFQYVDAMPITYDNSQWAKAYSLLNAKVGYRTELLRHFELDVFAGGNNLLGSTYYTMVFLNANFSGPPPNIYLPGPSTPLLYGGATLSYKL